MSLKPALIILSSMAPVCPFANASGFIMVKVRFVINSRCNLIREFFWMRKTTKKLHFRYFNINNPQAKSISLEQLYIFARILNYYYKLTQQEIIEVQELLSTRKRIVIVTHKNPDGDA